MLLFFKILKALPDQLLFPTVFIFSGYLPHIYHEMCHRELSFDIAFVINLSLMYVFVFVVSPVPFSMYPSTFIYLPSEKLLKGR